MATISERRSQDLNLQNSRQLRSSLHAAKMEEIAGGRLPESYSPINKNLKASPYSVLRQSDEQEVQATVEQMLQQAAAANHGGHRTTRTELLRQLALKQKLAKNPSLGLKVKMTRGAADHLAMDPLINDPSRSVDYS